MEQDIKSRLIKVRNAFNESVYSFAKKLNIPQPTLLRYENEERKIANKLLVALVNICNVDINWLLTGHGEMFQQEKQNTLERRISVKDIENTNGFGKKLQSIQTKNQLLDGEMADILKINESDFIRLKLEKNEPNMKILNELKRNFIVDIDWLLYGNDR